ncbi:MAG: hypothetical protein EXS05_19905 [Planctomycetaceae bacterium]|nr:hypothetical protein [Planctomycetaceae bacterium]
MTRFFSTLAIVSTFALLATFWLGWQIDDASSGDRVALGRVTMHLLTAVAALLFAVFVHAIVLTYFMGTGRWLEETCAAYSLGNGWQARSRNLKWRMYPVMILSLVLLIATGAFGGAADPASALGFKGIGPLTAAQVHQSVAVLTMLLNAAVNVLEFQALRKNAAVINDVLAEVRRIRLERGLAV